MDPQLRTDNHSTLAKIAAGITFPYTWIGLFLLLSWMYGGNFFGQDLGGSLVAALLCLGLLNPFVPGLITNYLVFPVFKNVLGREIVSTGGCLLGLLTFFGTGLAMVYYLSRDLTMAGYLFVAAPVAGGILTGLVSGVGRMRLPRLSSGRKALPLREVKPESRPLPGKSDRPALPGTSSRPAIPPRSSTRQLPPRRTEQNTSPDRRIPPPRRRE